MSDCCVAFCSFCKSPEIWATKSTDKALKGSRITIGASRVSMAAASPGPRSLSRNRSFSGNRRNARNAAHDMGLK